MANNITLAAQWVPQLEEVYKMASVTSILDGASMGEIQAGANAHEIIVPKRSMDGLGNYDKDTGYAGGSVTLTTQTMVCNFERSKRLSVDRMDNQEAFGLPMAGLAADFERQYVAPELDAFRFAKLAAIATENGGRVNAALTTGDAIVKALRAANTYMDEAEVQAENRVLFITSALKGAVDDMDTTKSRAVMGLFSNVIVVPQSRFYTKITQKDGTTAYGYAKDTNGQDINFVVVDKAAVVQYTKLVAPKFISADENQNLDADVMLYRIVSLADAYDTKVKGIYVHAAAADKAST